MCEGGPIILLHLVYIYIHKCGYPKVDTPKQLKFLSFSKHIHIHKCGYPNVDTQKWIRLMWLHQIVDALRMDTP